MENTLKVNVSFEVNLNGFKLASTADGDSPVSTPAITLEPKAPNKTANVPYVETDMTGSPNPQSVNIDGLYQLPKADLERALFLCTVGDGLSNIMSVKKAEDAALRLYEQYMTAAKHHCTWMLPQEAANAIVDLVTSEQGMLEKLEAMSDEVLVYTVGNRVKDSLKAIMI